jgi:hypothetical protein
MYSTKIFKHKMYESVEFINVTGAGTNIKARTACLFCVNPLNTKRRPLYLKTQFVPCGKHF